MGEKGGEGDKGEGTKEACVPSLPRGILFAKGVDVRTGGL
mgnify:CR=1 FL=1